MAVTEDDLRRFYSTVEEMVLRTHLLFRCARRNNSLRFAQSLYLPSRHSEREEKGVNTPLPLDETLRIAEETELYRLSAPAGHFPCSFCGYEGACWSNAVILSACVDFPSTILSAISDQQGEPKGAQAASKVAWLLRLADLAPFMARPNSGVFQVFVKRNAETQAASLTNPSTQARMVASFEKVREAVVNRFSAITSQHQVARFALFREHATVLLEMRRDRAIALEGENGRHPKRDPGVMLTQREIDEMQKLCKSDDRATKVKIMDRLQVGSAKAQLLMAHARIEGWLKTKPRKNRGKPTS